MTSGVDVVSAEKRKEEWKERQDAIEAQVGQLNDEIRRLTVEYHQLSGAIAGVDQICANGTVEEEDDSGSEDG